jgi:hypothetical protein
LNPDPYRVNAVLARISQRVMILVAINIDQGIREVALALHSLIGVEAQPREEVVYGYTVGVTGAQKSSNMDDRDGSQKQSP